MSFLWDVDMVYIVTIVETDISVSRMEWREGDCRDANMCPYDDLTTQFRNILIKSITGFIGHKTLHQGRTKKRELSNTIINKENWNMVPISLKNEENTS